MNIIWLLKMKEIIFYWYIYIYIFVQDEKLYLFININTGEFPFLSYTIIYKIIIGFFIFTDKEFIFIIIIFYVFMSECSNLKNFCEN